MGDPDYMYEVPYGTDYPWYNPVWPEASDDIVYERGTISLFGSITQRRRGFIHRSGSDPYNHALNVWDIDNHQYDGHHPSTGYDKNYHYDSRLLETELIDFPYIDGIYSFKRDLFISNSLDEGENFEQPDTLGLDTSIIFSRAYFSENEDLLLLTCQKGYKEIEVYESLNNGLDFSFLTDINMTDMNTMYYRSTNLVGDNILYLSGDRYPWSRSVNRFDLDTGNLVQIYYDSQESNTSDFNISNDGVKIFSKFDYSQFPEFISINYSIDDQLDNEIQWMPEVLEEAIIEDMSNYILMFDESDSLYIFFYGFEDQTDIPRSLYLIKGSIEGVTPETEDEIPDSNPHITISPNPFNPVTELAFYIPMDSEVNISVYNIKGQKINTLIDQHLAKGSHSVKWYGNDTAGLPASSGIYFLKLKYDQGELYKKMVLLK